MFREPFVERVTEIMDLAIGTGDDNEFGSLHLALARAQGSHPGLAGITRQRAQHAQ